MDILAHRGNIDGPDLNLENTYEAYERALSLGFGLEIDLRRSGPSQFYVSHDRLTNTASQDLSRFAPLFRRYSGSIIAVNVKELGYEEQLAALQESGVFGSRSFFFDFELLEPDAPGTAQGRIQRLANGSHVALAARISDRGESVERCLSIPSQTVWADEFDRFWIEPAALQPLKQAGRRIYIVSPELHGASRVDRLARWHAIKLWKVDGICTDHCCEADLFFHGVQHASLSA